MNLRLLLPLALATLAGIASSAVSANDNPASRRTQLLSFHAAPIPKAGPHRRTEVMLFDRHPVARDKSPAPEVPAGQIATAMLSQFDDLQRQTLSPQQIVLAGHRLSGGTSFVRIPGWMRAQEFSVTGRFPDNLSGGLPTIGRCNPRPYQPSTIMGHPAEERRALIYPLVHQAACEAGLPVGLMDAMIMQESRYNPFARSPAGAFGLGQLMPGTARDLGVDRYDLRGNLAGAARYLKTQLEEFGQPHLALAAYNAGPGRVRKTGRVPRIAETQEYVRNVLANWRDLERDHAQR